MRSASKFASLTRAELRASLRKELIELSRSRVCLDLSIPDPRIELKKPASEFGQIGRSKGFNLRLDFLYLTHLGNLKRRYAVQVYD